MVRWFWYFMIYSLLGYGLEKVYARAAHSPRQVRKCFLLLPLCPVYGLAMCLVLAAAPVSPLQTVLVGAAGCTGAEYLVHLFYDRVFRVQFWDYSGLRGNIRGRICPQFALIWGLLSALAVWLLQPSVDALAGTLPPEAAYGLWLVLAADCVCSAAVLLRQRDPEALALTDLVRQMRASSQSSTSR